MIEPFFANFKRSGINPIVSAKEDGAAYMADGYGRARKNFGVCMGIGGPGVTNMVTPISAAYGDRSSVLAIAGSIKFEWRGKGTFQDSSATGVDDIAIMKPMTAFAQIVPKIDKTAPFLKKAIEAMRGIENLPAFLSIPLDSLREPFSESYIPLHLTQPPRIVDDVSIQQLPELLASFTRIVILAGNGCVLSQADAEIKEFAKEYNIPVVTTLRAKGAIPEDDPMSFGVFGLGGSLQANKVVMGGRGETTGFPKAELLLVLGATLNENNTHQWADKFQPEVLVRVDINPNNVTGAEYNERFIMGDVKTVLSWIKDNKQDYDVALKESLPERKKWIESIRDTPYYDTENDRKSDKIPINPARIIVELRKAFPRDTVLVVDSGAHTFFTGHHWSSYAPNEFLLLSTTGPMGYGISTGIGAWLARQDQPCVCVVGDGSMLMGGMELHTAIRYNIPLVVVVINNSSLANVSLHLQDKGEGAKEITEIPTINWADFAQSLGAEGMTVKNPNELANAFTKAFIAKKLFLINVICDPNYMTPNTGE
jgi:acetolactate synthase-1/2/3 large subunit